VVKIHHKPDSITAEKQVPPEIQWQYSSFYINAYKATDADDTSCKSDSSHVASYLETTVLQADVV